MAEVGWVSLRSVRETSPSRLDLTQIHWEQVSACINYTEDAFLTLVKHCLFLRKSAMFWRKAEEESSMKFP